MRRLYGRDHLDHVLGTFGLILFFNELVRLVWGPAGMNLPLPTWLNTSIADSARLSLLRCIACRSSSWRWRWRSRFIFVVMRTRIGMLVRAGASNREMVGALGINIKLLYTFVFGIGAALAGLAGMMQAPILTAQIGMGENMLILAFVVIIIGGIGSIRGAFVAAILVGLRRHGRPRLPAGAAEARSKSGRGLDGRPGPVVDADLPADGGRAGGAAGWPVSGGGHPMTPLFTARNARHLVAARRAGAGAGLCADARATPSC